MGSDNRGLWKALGIKAKRTGEISCSIPHPARRTERLHFLADVPHLLKRIRITLTKHKDIFLPPDTVREFKLSTNKVSTSHILDLCNLEKEMELKVAFQLKMENIGEVGHYEKMRIDVAKSLICHHTYVGLKLLSESKPEVAATAWFIHLVNKWFDIVTSRTPLLALSLSNPALYAERINHLKLTMRVFRSMLIGEDNSWKPVQEGVLISTSSILMLQEELLGRRGYRFVLTSRFTQDFVENLFSMISSTTVQVHTP